MADVDSSSPIAKRRKLNDEHPPLALDIKEEDDEEDILPPPRRLITQGSKRYAPLPGNCQKGAPGHKKNRAVWSKMEMDKLKEGGLVAVRMFVREDGMVIDWMSSRPVWSDTLEPADSSTLSSLIGIDMAYTSPNSNSLKSKTKKRPLQKGHSITETEALARPAIPLPGRPVPIRDDELYTDGAHPFGEGVTADPSLTNNAHSGSITIGNGHSNEGDPSRAADQMTMEDDVDEEDTKDIEGEVEELQGLALDFLRKYIKRFDGDRAEVFDAYSEDAVFSYRANGESQPSLVGFVPEDQHTNRGLTQGPHRIVPVLMSFSTAYKFCAPQQHAEMAFDFSCLNAQNVLLIVYSEMKRIADEEERERDGAGERLMVNQSFVLRKKAEGSEESVWPLVAVSHQMAIRVMPLPEEGDEEMES